MVYLAMGAGEAKVSEGVQERVVVVGVVDGQL